MNDRSQRTPSPLASLVRSGAVANAVLLGVIAFAVPAAAQNADFSGAWETTYGMLELEQDGATVRGIYTYGGGSTIEGTVDGDRLTFRYQEPQAAGEGWFDMVAGGDAFSGQWRQDGGGSWFPWEGQRSSRAEVAAPSSGFSGLYDSSYGRLRLVRDGDRVTGTYAHGGGSTIEGTVQRQEVTGIPDGGESPAERLVFRYQEPDTAGEGWFDLGPGGTSLTGQWRADGGSAWSEWTATRVLPEPGRVWLIVLEAPWETSLAENEYAFGDMLRAYFERMPNVAVRHRRMYDVADFERSMRELTYLAEPVALLVASHGIDGELVLGGERLNAEHFRRTLAQAPNVFLLHFSSCDTMTNGMPEAIEASLPEGRRVAISGYATFVDWSASALIEFLYLDLVLGRGLLPAEAAAVIQREIRFAGDTPDPASPLGAAQFRFVD